MSIEDAAYHILRERLQGEAITIPIAYPGGITNVTYYIRLPERQNELEEPKRVIDWVVEYVDSWDLLDDDGEPILITTEALATKSLDILYAVYRGVDEDMCKRASAFQKAIESKNSPTLARVLEQQRLRLANRKPSQKKK